MPTALAPGITAPTRTSSTLRTRAGTRVRSAFGVPVRATETAPSRQLDLRRGSLGPGSADANYVTPPAASPTLSTSQLNEVKQLAVASGTYYAAGNCNWFNNPTAATVVYVTGDCSGSGLNAVDVGYNSSTGTCSSYTFLVVANGTVSLGGSTDYCGVIYAPNLSGVSGDVVTMEGNATLFGGLNVDGNASLSLGDSGNGSNCTDTSRSNKCGDLEFYLGAFLNIDGFAGADPTSELVQAAARHAVTWPRSSRYARTGAQRGAIAAAPDVSGLDSSPDFDRALPARVSMG